MNKSKLKLYDPAARREFIQAVTDRAYFYGLSENKNEIQPVEEKGDVAIIGGRAFPRKLAAQRKNLEQRIEYKIIRGRCVLRSITLDKVSASA